MAGGIVSLCWSTYLENINITSKRAPVPRDQKDHVVKVKNGIYARGNEKHSEMDCSLHQMQGSSSTGCQTKDPSKCRRAFQSRQQQRLHTSFPRSSSSLPLSAASPICLLPLYLVGDKVVKAVDTISTTPNFGIAFTIWKTCPCSHLHYTHTHTIINTLLACAKLSGWESTP